MGTMKINEEKPKRYIVECITMYGTRIGGRNLDPGAKPEIFTEDEYIRYKKLFDHYVSERVITVIEEGQKAFGMKVEQIKAIERAKEDAIPRGQKPLEPIVITRRDRESANVGDEGLVVKSAKEIMEGGDNDSICIAATKAGERCSNERQPGKRVCSIHLRSIQKKRTVTDCAGNNLTIDNINY